MNTRLTGASAPVFFAVCLGLTALLYWPALHGPFVFDDFAPTNLPALGSYGGVRDWETLWLYLTEAHAGPTGRPVSMLSFLLNATDWPADPYPFKLTNLILHLVNGALLYLALLRLLRPNTDLPDSGWVALPAAGWWLIHPMWASTVLYAVQRMAMLPVTFFLLGLLVYLHGRALLPARRGYVWMSAAVTGATLLAVLSKENGALLPLLLLIVESVWLSRQGHPRPTRGFLAVFLGLPALAVVAYLLLHIPRAESAYATRPFTLEERLLTEARILCEYLWRLFFPRLHGSGLFHDGFPVSHSLLSPPVTLPALVAAVALPVSAWLLRRRFPLYALAVLFFFAGHLVESTVVPLELYYEHRNYLPSLFLFLPPAAALVRFGRKHRPLCLFPAALLLLLGLITLERAQTWRSEYRLLTTWALENPDSVRAQIYGAMVLQNHSQHRKAYALLQQAAARHPQSLSLQLYAFSYECVLGQDARPRLAVIQSLLRATEFDFHDYDMFANTLENIHQGRCRHIPPQKVYALLDLLESNRAFQKHPAARRQIAHWRGEYLLRNGHASEALRQFRQSQRWMPDLDAGMMQVALLASAGRYDEALELLSLLERLRREGRGIKPGMDYRREMERIRRQLLADLRSSGRP